MKLKCNRRINMNISITDRIYETPIKIPLSFTLIMLSQDVGKVSVCLKWFSLHESNIGKGKKRGTGSLNNFDVISIFLRAFHYIVSTTVVTRLKLQD